MAAPTQTFVSKNIYYIVLLVCCIPLFFLNIHSTHEIGGDDFAQYIKEAKNIAEGKPYYLSGYIFNPYNNIYAPPQYPPGFPLLIAPVVKMFGIAIRPLCYFNTILTVILAFSFFEYMRKYMSRLAAICISILVVYSYMILDHKQCIFSDMPNMLLILLYMIFRNSKTFPWYRILLLVLFASMAMLTRTQSVLVIVAEGIYLLLAFIKESIARRKIYFDRASLMPSVYIIAGSVLLTLFLYKVVFYCPTPAAGFYSDYLLHSLHNGIGHMITENAGFLPEAIQRPFYYEADAGIDTAIAAVIQGAALSMCVAGFLYSVSRRLSFDDIFFVLSCGLIVSYLVHDTRFFMPAIPILYYYCYTVLAKVLPVLTRIRLRYIGLATTALCLYIGSAYIKKAEKDLPGGAPQKQDYQAFSYLSTHISDTDVILCAGPRFLTLYTDKKYMIYAWQMSVPGNKRVCDSMHVDYVLNMYGIAGDFFRAYLALAHPTDSVNIANGYVLYKLGK